MPINKKLITFDTIAQFKGQNGINNTDDTQTSDNGYVGNIPYRSIVFIKDTQQIWTHGRYFNCTDTVPDLSDYVTLSTSLTITGAKIFTADTTIGDSNKNTRVSILSKNTSGDATIIFDNGTYTNGSFSENLKGYISVSGYGNTYAGEAASYLNDSGNIHGMIFKLPRNIGGYHFRNFTNDEIFFIDYQGNVYAKDIYATLHGSATTLATGRALKVDLNSENSSTVFNGSLDITDIGISGILSVSHGGTGANTFTSGYALIGNGTEAITTKEIINNTTGSLGTDSTSLVTALTIAKAIDNAIISSFDANNVLVFKGNYTANDSSTTTVSGEFTPLVAASSCLGWVWVCTTAGYFANEKIEVGDLIIAKTEVPGTNKNNYIIVLKNIDPTAYLPLTGGTITGNLTINGTIFDLTANSASAHYVRLGNLTGTNNSPIIILALNGGLTIGQATTWGTTIGTWTQKYVIDNASSIYPYTTNTYNLGTSSKKWATIYATTFNGNITSTSKYNIKFYFTGVSEANGAHYFDDLIYTTTSRGLFRATRLNINTSEDNTSYNAYINGTLHVTSNLSTDGTLSANNLLYIKTRSTGTPTIYFGHVGNVPALAETATTRTEIPAATGNGLICYSNPGIKKTFSVAGDDTSSYTVTYTNTSQFSFVEYSLTNAVTNGKYERYYLPACDAERTANAIYNILTTKNTITIAQGGTGATTQANALKNIMGSRAIGSVSLSIYWSGTEFLTVNGLYLPLSGGTITASRTLPLAIGGGSTNYLHNIQLLPSDNWSGILFCGNDKTTAGGGISTNSFWIGNNNGLFSITKGNSGNTDKSLYFNGTNWYANTHLIYHEGNLKFGYTSSGNNRAVQKDSDGNLYVVLEDVNNTNYLSLSGGSLNGKLVINPSYNTTTNSYNEGVRINAASNGWASVCIGGANNSTADTGGVWVIGKRGFAGTYGAAGDFTIEYDECTGTGLTLQAASNGQMLWKGNTIWNAGNDGSGSGLDADLLDGHHASEFLTSRGYIGTTAVQASSARQHLTGISSIFLDTGDATLKIYDGRQTDGVSDGNICLQTSIDATDGETYVYPTNYEARCTMSLQPRGGRVYIGTNPNGGNTTYKLYVNGNTFSTGFYRNGSSDDYVLLGGGGHKALSEFTTSAGSVTWDNVTGKPSWIGSSKPTYSLDEVSDGSTRKLANYLPLSGGIINANNAKAPLILKGGTDSYREGLRIIPTSSWSNILLAGNDASEASGTSANSWFIGNNNGNFYITRNGSSSSSSAILSCVSNLWSINGNTIIHSGNIGSQSVNYANSAGSVAWANVTGKPTIPAGTVTSVATGTGLTGGTITSTGTISIDSTYQTYITNGNTAYGWGNHASAGYLVGRRVTNPNYSSTLVGITPFNVLGYKGSGYPIYDDPEFASGTNSVVAYNNSGNNSVSITRNTAASFGITDSGNSSGYVLKIVSSGTASPGIGGFCQNILSRANAVFVLIFRAMIPTGRSVRVNSNSMGSSYSDGFITDVAGTGKWEWYARIVHCGSSGSFAGGGHVYLDGNATTSSAPVTWYLSYCNCIDITKGNYDGLKTKYADSVPWEGITGKPSMGTGTVTSVAVKMNGTVKGTITSSGTIDLGTVLTSHLSLSGYLPLSGGNMTGNITFDNNTYIYTKDSGGIARAALFMNSGNTLSFGYGTLVMSAGHTELCGREYVSLRVGTTSSSKELKFSSNGSATIPGSATISGDTTISGDVTASGAYYSNSDIRLKTIRDYLTLSSEDFSKLPIFKFIWNNSENNQINIGTSAQEVEKVLPELVGIKDDGYKSVNYAGLGTAASIINSREIVELKQQIKELKCRILELEKRS